MDIRSLVHGQKQHVLTLSVDVERGINSAGDSARLCDATPCLITVYYCLAHTKLERILLFQGSKINLRAKVRIAVTFVKRSISQRTHPSFLHSKVICILCLPTGFQTQYVC